MGRPDAPGQMPADAAAWIGANAVRVLNVAGDRESSSPGIGTWVEAFLATTFGLLDG